MNFNGNSTSAWGTSGSGIIEFKFQVTHEGTVKDSCNSQQPHVAMGFDGPHFWNIDIANNLSATSATLGPSTSAMPMTWGGWYAPNNTFCYTSQQAMNPLYNKAWQLENTSAIIGPMATSTANFRGFKSKQYSVKRMSIESYENLNGFSSSEYALSFGEAFSSSVIILSKYV